MSSIEFLKKKCFEGSQPLCFGFLFQAMSLMEYITCIEVI